MHTTSPWKPVLTGELAETAERSVLRIASDIRADERWAPAGMHPSLSGGSAGLAIFFHELSLRWPDRDFGQLRDQYWDATIDGLANAPSITPGLYGGFTGVGWASLFLADRERSEEDLDDTHEELDQALLESLDTIRDPTNYDLINGPTGWALYALERWPHQQAVRALELIVDFFDQRAERVEEGLRWHTAPELLPEWQREKSPKGYYNLGLSHGVPGVWVLLAHTMIRGIRRERSEALLEGAVRWGLAQQWREGIQRFPSIITDERVPPAGRLAWCYGDLGVAAALLVVGQVTGRSDWTQEAVALANLASRITRDVSAHVDAGLCHGAAGVGHIFGRFYQATGDTRFRTAGAYWLQVALDMKKDGTGPGGYGAWRQIPPPAGWDPRPGLLEGAAGIGLALLAASGDREPEWDRFLSISPVPVQSPKPLVENR